ncbi:MAG: hypothetical protein M0P64_01080 [Candidatus Pacebacteria bacterium]|jgi:hypothetical protein|nr:hypothetical protein [Candidatus Paceibacterota bacterium]
MEPSPLSKLEPGVYQGIPDNLKEKKSAAPRIVRTMKSDVAEAIRDQEETTVSIAVAEQKKRARLQSEAQQTQQASGEPAPAPKRIGRFIVIIIVLILLGLLGAAYVFVLPKLSAIKLPSVSLPSFGSPANTNVATTTAPTTPALANSLIPAQSEKRFDITKEARGQISKDIASELTTGDTAGNIKNLFFIEESAGIFSEISANRLIMFSGASAPEIFTRSLEKGFMVGLLVENVGASTPFIVLKVSERELGFAGMLEWEKSLPTFFDNMFGTNIGTGIPPETRFRDLVISGKDARMIADGIGSGIAYSFVNNTTIIIAGSRTALETLIPLASTK